MILYNKIVLRSKRIRRIIIILIRKSIRKSNMNKSKCCNKLNNNSKSNFYFSISNSNNKSNSNSNRLIYYYNNKNINSNNSNNNSNNNKDSLYSKKSNYLKNKILKIKKVKN